MRLPRSVGLEGRFRHDGQISWTDMPDYYRAADIMVSPSSNDSQPNCMLEAMSCGTPVVMGDIPAIREWVSGARNGLLFPPRDSVALAKAMLSLLRDPARRETFAAMNRRIVADHVDSKEQCRRIKELVVKTLRGAAAS